MKEKRENRNLVPRHAGNEEKNVVEGYPVYPATEDIYRKYHEVKDIDPEDISKMKELNENDKEKSDKEKDSFGEIDGRELDVPGSELDDQLEDIGSEDEENNYYSIGGDGHDDLDEDKGE